MSTSPAINRTAKPIDAISIIDNCPDTFIIFRKVKKYSDANEKKIKTIAEKDRDKLDKKFSKSKKKLN